MTIPVLTLQHYRSSMGGAGRVKAWDTCTATALEKPPALLHISSSPEIRTTKTANGNPLLTFSQETTKSLPFLLKPHKQKPVSQLQVFCGHVTLTSSCPVHAFKKNYQLLHFTTGYVPAILGKQSQSSHLSLKRLEASLTTCINVFSNHSIPCSS